MSIIWVVIWAWKVLWMKGAALIIRVSFSQPDRSLDWIYPHEHIQNFLNCKFRSFLVSVFTIIPLTRTLSASLSLSLTMSLSWSRSLSLTRSLSASLSRSLLLSLIRCLSQSQVRPLRRSASPSYSLIPDSSSISLSFSTSIEATYAYKLGSNGSFHQHGEVASCLRLQVLQSQISPMIYLKIHTKKMILLVTIFGWTYLKTTKFAEKNPHRCKEKPPSESELNLWMYS